MNKRAFLVLAVSLLGIIVASAGCTSSTNTTAPSLIKTEGAQNVTASLNAFFSTHYHVVDNFTLASASQGSSVYNGAFQDPDGTLHLITLYLVQSNGQAKGVFEAQKASYADKGKAPNTTVTANNSTHWSVTTNTTAVQLWSVEPKTAGPFDLTIDSPYVLVSVDTRPPTTMHS